MKIYSSIRISDDIAEGTSYYLQEVLTVKRFIDASQEPAPCLFALDELFKGTNTTERIAAGKAVLAHLNRGPHLVLVSTHDVELADLLRKDGYELHHFREEVIDGKLVFDYQLHTGPPHHPQRHPDSGNVRLSARPDRGSVRGAGETDGEIELTTRKRDSGWSRPVRQNYPCTGLRCMKRRLSHPRTGSSYRRRHNHASRMLPP